MLSMRMRWEPFFIAAIETLRRPFRAGAMINPAEPKERKRVMGFMNRFQDYLDMAVHCAANARRTSDPRHRSFLVDMAEGWCERAREVAPGVATGLERLTETANEVADLAASETQPPGLQERALH